MPTRIKDLFLLHHIYGPMRSIGRFWRPIVLMLVSAIIMVSWSFIVPIFEAPDEPHHWQFARYIHINHSLPLYCPEFVEANSPPLYYMLIAPFASGDVDPPHMIRDSQRGPRHKFYRNSNEDFSKYWPMRTARFATAFLSVLAVLFCYLTGFEASRNRNIAFLAGGLMAFLPQFTFRGMNVSNDAMVTLMCAVVMYLIVRILKGGFNWPLGTLTAAMIALAFLSKINAIFLPIPFSLAILSETVPWRIRFSRLGVLVVTLGIVSPWLLHNHFLYGDPIARGAMETAVSYLIDKHSLFSPYFVTIFPSALGHSFVGAFGWMSLWLPEWIYRLFGLLAAVSMMGYLWRWYRGGIDTRLIFILSTVPLLSLMVTIYINITFSQPQGRYLFPALSAIALLVAIGLEGLPGWNRWLTYSIVGILAILNVYILCSVVYPTYWTLPSVNQDAAETPLGRLSGSLTIGQSFVSPCAGLNRIDILVGTYKQQNRGTIHFNLFVPGSNHALVSKSFDSSKIPDNSYLRVRFAPLRSSQGCQYYFDLRATDTRPNEGVAIWSSSGDTLANSTSFINGSPAQGDLAFRAFCYKDWGRGQLASWVRQITMGPQ